MWFINKAFLFTSDNRKGRTFKKRGNCKFENIINKESNFKSWKKKKKFNFK